MEFRSAARQRERAGDLTHDMAGNLIESMDEHFANFFLVQPITDLVIQEAAALLDRHALRAYDASCARTARS